jgi:hypothetical protein
LCWAIQPPKSIRKRCEPISYSVLLFIEHPLIRRFPHFRRFVLGIELGGIPFFGCMVTSYVPTSISIMVCLTMWGLLPLQGGFIVGDGGIFYSPIDEEDIRVVLPPTSQLVLLRAGQPRWSLAFSRRLWERRGRLFPSFE